MSRITEIARILGCMGSNVCYLLRKARIKGIRTSAGWVVSDEAVQEYLAGPRRQPPPVKNKLHKGQKFGYWTVLDPEAGKNKNGQRTALVQCICGKTRKLAIIELVGGHSCSCGCRRAENFTQQQQEGKKKGTNLCARYTGRNWPAGTWISMSTKTAILVIPGCAGGKTCRSIMPTLW